MLDKDDLPRSLALLVTEHAAEPHDRWRRIVQALRAYAGGAEEYFDYRVLTRDRAELLKAVTTPEEKVLVGAWIDGLKEPSGP